MQVSEQWLREWVDPGLPLEALAEQLTQAGLEVEGITAAAPAFSGVVVGEILRAEPHPDAARLRVCRVSLGAAQPPLTIVCGAPNAAAGCKAPLAMLGAILPGDKRIGPATLRGVESQGMLCSARELGLPEYGQEGLWLLPSDAPVGVDLRQWLHWDSRVLSLKLTPNRGDCLSVQGIARELAAINRLSLHLPDAAACPAAIADVPDIRIQDAAACPVYVGRIIRGLDPAALTPLWMQERLRLAGLRPLGPLVDVTNYVMLELGQPMHAFDLAQVAGGIEVRHARPGETLTLLDGRSIRLAEDELLVCDSQKPLALAGIMGGEGSGIRPETCDVLLEAAHFAPLAVVGRARRHGLHTESSHRFERGVDPALPERAVERATRLLLAMAGGRPGPVRRVGRDIRGEERPGTMLRAARLEAVLGCAIPAAEVEALLRRLAVEVRPVPAGWLLRPPSHRFDLELEADYIEEVARLHGYENLPEALPHWPQRFRPEPEAHVPLMRFKHRLVERGYHEAVTLSFISPAEAADWGTDEHALRLDNPISEDLAVMRQSLWPSLIRVVMHNQRRQHKRVRVFETGSVYFRQGEETREEARVAGAVCGTALPEQWRGDKTPADFFELKADVEALLSLSGRRRGWDFAPCAHEALHPGQSAQVEWQGCVVGWFGMLHPRLVDQLKLDSAVGLFELRLPELSSSVVAKFYEISQFPSIRRDLSVIVHENVPLSTILSTAVSAAGTSLKSIFPFDVYHGDGIGKGRKSVTLGLIFQDDSRTLTDDEADRVLKAVQSALHKNHGATVRG